MKPMPSLAALLVVSGSVALAHGGVENPDVLARLEGMKAMSEATKTIGEMAKGDTPFDADAARTALAMIADQAGETPALFAAQEMDPTSEARPEIWEAFEDFIAKAMALETLAGDMAREVETLEALRGGLGQIGARCKACHTEYRT